MPLPIGQPVEALHRRFVALKDLVQLRGVERVHAEGPVGHGEPRVERDGLLQVGNRLLRIPLMITGPHRGAVVPQCRQGGRVTRASGGSRSIDLSDSPTLARSCLDSWSTAAISRVESGAVTRWAVSTSPSFAAMT